MLLHDYYLGHKFYRKREFELEDKLKKSSDNINDVELQISKMKDFIDALNDKIRSFEAKMIIGASNSA